MIDLPLFPDYNVIEASYSENRINEARDYLIKKLSSIPLSEEVSVGCSCGKDSTITLQLTLEAFRAIGKPLETLRILHQRTRYETNAATEWTKHYIETARENGYNIEVYETPLWADYSVWTLGFGAVSFSLKYRKCNQMKSSIVKENGLNQFALSISGTRAEESTKRRNDPRETKNDYGNVIRPIKLLTTGDVWGYLKKIGKADFGISYDELKHYYDTNTKGRDGCWVCYAGRFKSGTLAQQELRTRLQLLRRDTTIEKILSPDYPLRTIQESRVHTIVKLNEAFITNRPLARSWYRPVRFCIAAFEVVKDIERRRGEILIPDNCKRCIEDLQKFRFVYDIHTVKKWQLNRKFWNGLNLMDFDEVTENEMARFNLPRYIPNRCNGDWFRRYCFEQDRSGIWNSSVINHLARYTRQTDRTAYDDIVKARQKIRASGYMRDMNREPLPGVFAAAGVDLNKPVEDTEMWKRATDVEYRQSIIDAFYAFQKEKAADVIRSYDEHPELFKEPDGLFCGDNIVKFCKENNL